GNGGSLNLQAAGAPTFTVGSASPLNGVSGSLIDNARPLGGNGGVISITSDGSGVGGISLTDPTAIQASASVAGGNGGQIAIVADYGPVFINGGFNVSGTGAGNGG